MANTANMADTSTTSKAPAGFPVDWLEEQGREPATDLDLAVLLVNTFDLLEDPADRLDDLDWIVSAYDQVGQARLASDLKPSDLRGLRELRGVLRTAFEAHTVEAAAD